MERGQEEGREWGWSGSSNSGSRGRSKVLSNPKEGRTSADKPVSSQSDWICEGEERRRRRGGRKAGTEGDVAVRLLNVKEIG